MNTTIPALANLGPLQQLKAGRLAERVLRLLAGLWLYGLAIALMIKGTVGASPWDVFHLGVSLHLPLSFGMVMIVAAVVVLLAWIPLRQMPGLGTLANTLLIGPFADLNLALLATPDGLPLRSAYMLTGVVVCAFATALYIGAQLGPGPRDGLMTGLARRTGWPLGQQPGSESTFRRFLHQGPQSTISGAGALRETLRIATERLDASPSSTRPTQRRATLDPARQ